MYNLLGRTQLQESTGSNTWYQFVLCSTYLYPDITILLFDSGLSPFNLAFDNGHERVVKLLLEHDSGDPYEVSDGHVSMMEKAIVEKWNKLGHFIFWLKKVDFSSMLDGKFCRT